MQQQVKLFQALFNWYPIVIGKREIVNRRLAMMGLISAVINYGFTGWIILVLFSTIILKKMALSYWLRAEVDDLLNEDTFFDSSEYSCLLEDTDWA